MGEDEEGTYERPRVNPGDGILVEFPSVIEAISCAVAVLWRVQSAACYGNRRSVW